MLAVHLHRLIAALLVGREWHLRNVLLIGLVMNTCHSVHRKTLNQRSNMNVVSENGNPTNSEFLC